MSDKMAILRDELDRLRAQIATLRKTVKDKPDYGLGKGDPAITRWEIDRVLLRRLEREAAGIEQTLSTMVEDEYGICGRCGRAIHPDRLAVLPNTKVCIQCARAAERRRVGPAPG